MNQILYSLGESQHCDGRHQVQCLQGDRNIDIDDEVSQHYQSWKIQSQPATTPSRLNRLSVGVLGRWYTNQTDSPQYPIPDQHSQYWRSLEHRVP